MSNTTVVSAYERWAPIYDWIWRGYLDGTFRVALDALKLTGGERILDVACGTGELERRITHQFPNQAIVGVDITEAMLAVARRKLAGVPNVVFQQATSESLPFPDADFDVVITCSALHYMRHAQQFFHEAARLLKPGGRFIILDWCRDDCRGKFYDTWRRWVFRSHHRVYSSTEVRSFLANAGLTPIAIRQFTILLAWGMMCVEVIKQRS